MPETTTQGNLDSGDPELKKKAAVLVRGRLRALEQPAAWDLLACVEARLGGALAIRGSRRAYVEGFLAYPRA